MHIETKTGGGKLKKNLDSNGNFCFMVSPGEIVNLVYYGIVTDYFITSWLNGNEIFENPYVGLCLAIVLSVIAFLSNSADSLVNATWKFHRFPDHPWFN